MNNTMHSKEKINVRDFIQNNYKPYEGKQDFYRDLKRNFRALDPGGKDD